jgi:hypothetical protein
MFRAFLTSVVDKNEWSASRFGRFTPWDITPCTIWIGGLVGPIACLNTTAKTKIPVRTGNSHPIQA